jgi:hypothetical protein
LNIGTHSGSMTFTVTKASGNTVVAGTLQVTGATTLTGLVTTGAGGLTLGTGAVTWDNGTTNFCVVATYNGNAVTWAAGAAPAFVNGHPYIKIMCNGTQYRIPVFKDA